jgi:hypothetical protein
VTGLEKSVLISAAIESWRSQLLMALQDSVRAEREATAQCEAAMARLAAAETENRQLSFVGAQLADEVGLLNEMLAGADPAAAAALRAEREGRQRAVEHAAVEAAAEAAALQETASELQVEMATAHRRLTDTVGVSERSVATLRARLGGAERRAAALADAGGRCVIIYVNL